ncbi:chemotaxis protein CheB [Rhizobium sp. 12,4]|uniref:chemotaxis protein CheB n=1 Tax=Rhizobium sp. 12,4 TaxID=3405135 RepID=UPI003D33E989
MKRDVVAIGASAGGIEAVSKLLSYLPAELPAAVLVVIHRPIEPPSYLPEVLARLCALPVRFAREGGQLEHGTCLLSPPGRHLSVSKDCRVHLLADGFYRAHNVDALFMSLAAAIAPRTIGVILSGALKDGTLGLKFLKEAGGIALVQDPAEASFPDMPENAAMHDGEIDLIGPIETLAEFICEQVGLQPLSLGAPPAG